MGVAGAMRTRRNKSTLNLAGRSLAGGTLTIGCVLPLIFGPVGSTPTTVLLELAVIMSILTSGKLR